jgi:hypothetical protein
MFDFARWFRKTFRIDTRFTPRSQPTGHRKNPLRLEQLEDRTVPTILFTPQYGAESVTNGGGPVLSNMPVYTIFWGSYWGTAAGSAQVSAIRNAALSIYDSPMYGLTKQYGTDGHVYLAAAYTVDTGSNPNPSGFSDSDLQNEVSRAIDTLGLPDSDQYSNTPLYMVFTGPGMTSSTYPNAGGYHSDTTFYHAPFDFDQAIYGWTGDFGSLDSTTTILSHETAEAMTDPLNPPGNGITVNAGPSFPGGGYGEIGDFEAQNYTYRLNGYQVQSLWSQSNQAFAVSDGNSQNFYVNNGQLTIDGDQFGSNYNDSITVGLNSSGGVLVNLNGEVASFDPGQISSIVVDGGGGADTININGTAAGVPVTIDGNGTDVITIGNGDLDSLKGAVTVHGGGDTVTVNDQNAPFTDTYTITNSTVSRPFFAGLTYSSIGSLTLNGESGGNVYNVNGTAAGTSYILNGGTGSDTFNIGTGNPVSLQGAMTVHGGGGRNTLSYSGYQGDVLVDLPLGTATGVAGGISNIQNIVGSQGNDILVGNGGNVLTGGTGRNLLIAGKTASTLVGNSGEDILVGGTTNYDTNVQSLDAIMAEWTRTDRPYAARVNDLLVGGGLNGSTLLNVAAFHSNGGGNTLTGGAGLDLFYGLLPKDSSKPDTTDWNAPQGEIFIDPNGINVGVRIDATMISAPSLLLDGKQTISDSAAQWVTLQPGTHVLSNPAGYGSVTFTVNNDGTVSYAPALQGILSGQGSNQLTVNGAAVTVNGSGLTMPGLLLDSQTSESKAFTAYVLPGAHAVIDPAGYGAVFFTVSNSGAVSVGTSSISYASGIASVSNGNQLTVNGAAVTVNATDLTVPSLLLDGQSNENASAPFTVHLLPGIHSLSDSSGSVTFTVNPDGTLSYPASEAAWLSLQGSMTLIVKALS